VIGRGRGDVLIFDTSLFAFALYADWESINCNGVTIKWYECEGEGWLAKVDNLKI
jgi:hypothetical protein